MSRFLTEKEKEKILTMYEAGYNTVEISNEILKSSSCVQRFLLKKNIKTRKNKKNLLPYREEIIKLYLDNKTAKEILISIPSLNVSQNTIIDFLRKNYVKIREKQKRTTTIHSYFDEINNDRKKYLLGILLTDGNVHKIKNRKESYKIQISLRKEDFYILYFFKKEVNSSTKISFYRNECHFSFNSFKMAQKLISLGIVERKSKDAKPLYQLKNERSYLLGLYDGDGICSISNNKMYIGICGTFEVVKFFKENIIKNAEINTNSKIYFNKKNKIYYWLFTGMLNIKKFKKYIYENQNIFLKRKKQKINDYLENIEITQ